MYAKFKNCLTLLLTISASKLIASQPVVIDLSGNDLTSETTVYRSIGPTVTPAFAYPIKPSDLNYNVTSGGMFTIVNSGRYYVSQDLVPKFTSSSSGVSVLYITASNVTLDLNSKSIKVHPQSNTTSSNLTGIYIPSGSSNISIINGQIDGNNGSVNVLTYGVQIYTPSKSIIIDQLQINQVLVTGFYFQGVHDLKLTNSSATNCSANSGSDNIAALDLESCESVEIENCDFGNNSTSHNQHIYAIHINDCANMSFKNVDASGNSTSTGNVASVFMEPTSCDNISFENVRLCQNSSTGTTAHTWGFYANGGSNIRFNQTDFSGHSATGNSATVHGFYGNDNPLNSTSFKNCKFSNLSGPESGTLVYGIQLQGNNCSFENCEASNNAGSGTTHGFEMNGLTYSKFINCSACNNSSSAEVTGFDLYNASTSNNFVNCDANNNSSNSTSDSNNCYGWQIYGGSDGNNFTNCQALNNSHTGSYSTYGFYIYNSSGNKFKQCLANENLAYQATCNGFGLIADDGSTVSNNLLECEASHNQSNESDAYGFGLSNCLMTRLVDCVSEGCIAQANNTSAIGFVSEDGTSNIFSGCKSLAHTCLGTGTLGANHTPNQLAAGFLLQDVETATRLENCQASNNNGGSGEGVGFGIYLRQSGSLTVSSTSAPVNTIVRNCNMEFNTSGGSSTSTEGNKYGFFDESQNTSSVLINNTSIGHGRCLLDLNTSFNFVDPSTSGTTPPANGMNYMFYHTGVDENPSNIIHETDSSNWTTISSSVPNWMNLSIVVGQLTTGSAGV